MKMLLDASAWIEFFLATEKGKAVRTVLREEACYTSVATVAEVANWALREERSAMAAINEVQNLSRILGVTTSMAALAGRLNFERKKANKKWGMMDSFVLATGSVYNMKILTKDPDFEDLPNVQMLK